MDPLSLTVSVVALMTTAVQTVRGLEKLRRAFGAQEKLLELFNEVSTNPQCLYQAIVVVGAMSVPSHSTSMEAESWRLNIPTI